MMDKLVLEYWTKIGNHRKRKFFLYNLKYKPARIKNFNVRNEKIIAAKVASEI
jgi:hypothetical protein